METVQTVAAETRAQMEKLPNNILGKMLMEYGMAIKGLTREEMIQQIVDLEVYAFTH